jgi:hypothetical protein
MLTYLSVDVRGNLSQEPTSSSCSQAIVLMEMREHLCQQL